MSNDTKIKLFENPKIRTAWDEEKEEWYFSVVDVVRVLTDQPDYRHASNGQCNCQSNTTDEIGQYMSVWIFVSIVALNLNI